MSKHFRSWHVIEIKPSPKGLEAIVNFCHEIGASGVELDGDIKAYFKTDRPIKYLIDKINDYSRSLIEMGIIESLPEITSAKVSEEDWAENWKDHFVPVEIGETFLVVPPWEKDLDSGDRIKIVIEPGMAFGTGNHESTTLALELVEKYIEPGDNVLDVGAGTGILAIGAAKREAASVLAIDNDPLCYDATILNCKDNGVSDLVETKLNSVENLAGTRYNKVIANLNTHLVEEFIDALIDGLADNGRLIISGIETHDEARIKEAFARKGLTLSEMIQMNNWLGFVFK